MKSRIRYSEKYHDDKYEYRYAHPRLSLTSLAFSRRASPPETPPPTHTHLQARYPPEGAEEADP